MKFFKIIHLMEQFQKDPSKEKDEEDSKPVSKDDENNDEEDTTMDGKVELPDQEDTSEENKKQQEIQEKFTKVAEDISKSFNSIVKQKSDIVMNKIKTVGVNQTISDFIEESYLRNLKDSNEKLFVTMNFNELVDMVVDALSSNCLRNK